MDKLDKLFLGGTVAIIFIMSILCLVEYKIGSSSGYGTGYNVGYDDGYRVSRKEVIADNTKLVNDKIVEAYGEGCSYAAQQIVAAYMGVKFNTSEQKQLIEVCKDARVGAYYNLR